MTLVPRLIARLAATLVIGAVMMGAAPTRADDACRAAEDQWAGPTLANTLSLYEMEWSPFGRPERGWETYWPLIRREVGVDCAPGSPGFAAALAAWQGRYGMPATGLFDAVTFQVLRGVWQERRPFVMARVAGLCPEPPPLAQLGYLLPEEEHADRLTRLLRRDALAAYRRMAEAARAENPEIAADPELMQIFSGFRDPEADAARCAIEGNCDGVRRAVCSPHRTGAAVDIHVGHAPGLGVDDTSPPSRLHMSRSPTYRWLADNAHRFGFVPYVFEPWHWEYAPEWSDPSPSAP